MPVWRCSCSWVIAGGLWRLEESEEGFGVAGWQLLCAWDGVAMSSMKVSSAFYLGALAQTDLH